MRNISLNLERKEVKNIMHRLKHNKKADTTIKRIRNAIERAKDYSRQLYREGKLKPTQPVLRLQTPTQLQQYINAIKKNGIYVLDFETTGVDTWNDILVGVALYTEGEKPAYLPINHTTINGNLLGGQISEEEAKKLLTPLFTDKTIKTILHNAKFDDKILFGNWGIRIANIYWDSMIAQHILNENESKGLKELYQRYIDPTDSGFDYGDLFGNSTPFNFTDLDIATIYGANDGIKTWQLYKFQSRWLNPKHPKKEFRSLYRLFTELEMALLPYTIEMELKGVKIDLKHFKELEKGLALEVARAETLMDKLLKQIKLDILADEELNRLTQGTGKINYNSPKQVQIVLYDILKLPSVDRRTLRGTGEGIIKKILSKTKNKALKQLLTAFLDYKEKRKLLTSFARKLPKEVEKKTDAIHSNFNQTGTKTGRFASTSPNLQQIPSRGEWGSKIRQGFKARDGMVFVGSDYSQIEPRTLASLVYKKTKGDDMFKAYENGKDLYVMMASKIYNLPEEECREFDSEGNFQKEGNFRRDSVKSVLLGIMYERGHYAIAEQFGKPAKWGEQIVKMFTKAFPHIEKYRQFLVYHAETLGYVQTISGRKRRLPDMQIKNKLDGRYKSAHRQVLNSVIQGSAGDILKKAMLEIGRDKTLRKLGAYMVLTIHDEVILEAPEEHKDAVGQRLSDIMKKVGFQALQIPMKCDVEIMKRWGE